MDKLETPKDFMSWLNQIETIAEFISWLSRIIPWLDDHAVNDDLSESVFYDAWRGAHAWATFHLSSADVEQLEPAPIMYIGGPGWAPIRLLKRLRNHLTGEPLEVNAGRRQGETLLGNVGVAAAIQNNGAAGGGHKRKGNLGRKADTDPKADQRIVDAWGRGKHYQTYADCARALNLTKKQVHDAIDRHRHRKRAEAPE